MTSTRLPAVALLALLAVAARAGAQAPDPAARLRQVLPPDVAQHVLARAEEARKQQLPGLALEERALKFAARGVPPAAIAKAVDEQADRMARARTVLLQARPLSPARDEIEAAAEALREGVDPTAIASLARSAPAGRSLSVPLFVMGSLTTRGASAADALHTVLQQLQARASDADLERLPDETAGRSADEAQSGTDAREGDASAAAGDRHAPDHPMARPTPHVPHPVAHRAGRP